jgi:hypothetical protein
MPARCRLSRSSSTFTAAAMLALITAARSPADTRSPVPGTSLRAPALMEPASAAVAPALRTDRLSPRQRERWKAIVAWSSPRTARRPLHPTLRTM